jgi:predicted NACHT family NTPase
MGGSTLAIKVELRRFIRKSGFDAAGNLVDFIASELSRQANIPKDAHLSYLIQHLLFFGRMMVVFDGVDEIISTSKRHDAIASLQQLANRFRQDRFLYTCRSGVPTLLGEGNITD